MCLVNSYQGIGGITRVASTISLICAYVKTTANMNEVARKDCQSIDERVIEVDKMHSALQSKSKESLSSMNVSSILLLIITCLSDELSIIDMNLSIEFDKEFRYEQKDVRFCISCFQTQNRIVRTENVPFFLKVKLDYKIAFNAQIFNDLSIRSRSLRGTNYEFFDLKDTITLQNRNWGMTYKDEKCHYAKTNLSSSTRLCSITFGDEQKFSSTHLIVEIDRSYFKKTLSKGKEYGVGISPSLSFHEGQPNFIQYSPVLGYVCQVF